MLGVGAGLAFLKIGGRDLPKILANFFRFTIGSKLYIWKRREAIVTFTKEVELKKGGKEGDIPLKSAGASRLKKMKTKLET